MKIYRTIFIFALVMLVATASSDAQTIKIITLKDGSVLKGKVIELKDNTYTLETSNLGRVSIPEADILSITVPGTSGSTYQQSNSSSNLSQKTQLKNQVQKIQGSILTDPGLMSELQSLINDKEIKALLSDPKLMNDVLSYDPEKIQQNDNVQNLMKNPKMLNLMNMIQQKIPNQ